MHSRRSFARLIAGLLLLTAALSAAGREFAARSNEEKVSGELIVRLKPGATADAMLASVVPGGKAQRLGRLNLHVIKLPPGAQAGLSTRIANHPDVEYVEPNRIRRASVSTPDDPNYFQQWSLQAIEAVSAWSVVPNRYLTSGTAGQPRIKVAVLDSGVDCSHPDFQNSGGTSSDSAQGGQISYALSRAFVASTKNLPGCPWADDNGHGTHTAGTVAAATNNARGVAALGYPIELIIYKVLNAQGSGTDAVISNAITAAADAGANVISLSLGGPGYSQSLQDAVNYAWQHNVLLVAAAGNSSSNQLTLPADANHAVAVAATDEGGGAAFYSNFGDFISIAAPGSDILSTAPTYLTPLGALNYATLSGTSMATPHVAALAGLVRMTTPSLSAAAIVERIQQSAASSAANGGWNESTGYGVIDSYNAVAGNLHPASVGSIVGQVVDGSSLPVADALVTAGGASFSTDSSGLFRLSNLAAGRYNVSVTASGFSMRTIDATVLAGADCNVTAVMGITPGTFTGSVTSVSGPASGAVVEALAGGLVVATAIADANGLYSLQVPAGTYDLRASGLSRITTTVASQSISANASLIVNLTLPKMGTIAGIVRDPNHHPLANAQITVTSGSFSSGAVTDLNGAYSTIGLPAGTYSVIASATGFQDPPAANIAVTNDIVSNVDIQLTYSPTGYPASRVNAGGAAYIDPQGRLWSADTNFTGGSTYSVTSAINGTATPTVYQSERYGVAQYRFVVPYGSYTVNLKFAELYFTQPGSRIFNVAINGQQVLTNFDVVGAAGAGLTAVDRGFPVNVTDGQIVIQFISVLSDPTINAIEITPVTVSPSGVTLTGSQSQQFTATVSGTANTAVTWSISPVVGAISATGLYTAPVTVPASQVITVTATSAVNGATTGSATVNLVPPGGVRVNAGGPAYTDAQGRVWSADTGSTGGSTYATSSTINGTTTPTLYQSERYGSFQYQFTVVNGTYNVNLKFAELYFTAPGQRVFNVTLNGQPALTNFDVVAAAGGGLKAVDRSFAVNVTNGQITLQWSAVTSTPTVNAIEITPQTGVGVSVNPASVALGASQTQQFTATVTGAGNTGVTWSVYPPTGTISNSGLYTAPATVTGAQSITVTATSVADQVTSGYATITLVPGGVIRVNAGGPSYTDAQGRVWTADTGFTGGNMYSVGSAIAGTSTPVIYQSERYGAATYQFAVLNGNYTVNLKFAELYYTQPGSRMFNVAINGQQVLANFDVVGAAGSGLKAVDRAFAVNVTTGQIVIQLTAVQSDPTINAIEISPVTVTPASITLSAGQTQQFNASTSVTWAADVGSISASGLYTAPSSVNTPQTAIVTATSTSDPTMTGYAMINLVPGAIRVNAGGAAYTDPQGRLWSADTGYSGGSTYSVGSAITGTTTPTLYQSERYGNPTYQFAVVNGNYTVNLKFAELYFTSAGSRKFNVVINGQTVLTNFDVVAAAGGGLKAVDRAFPVTVTNGQIVIQLVTVLSTPTLNAIEITTP